MSMKTRRMQFLIEDESWRDWIRAMNRDKFDAYGPWIRWVVNRHIENVSRETKPGVEK